MMMMIFGSGWTCTCMLAGCWAWSILQQAAITEAFTTSVPRGQQERPSWLPFANQATSTRRASPFYLLSPPFPTGDCGTNSGGGAGDDDHLPAPRRGSTHHDERHACEFVNLGPTPDTELRRKRIQQDRDNRAQFVTYGNELWNLRDLIDQWSAELMQQDVSPWRRMMSGGAGRGRDRKQRALRQKLTDAQQRDPELVYRMELFQLEQATQQGREVQVQEAHRARAMAARGCLPQFNLEGLWVGRYPSGYQLINVTYVGDTLVAYKVTGDHNVPRGQVSFQVDLDPSTRPHPWSSSSSSSSSSSTSAIRGNHKGTSTTGRSEPHHQPKKQTPLPPIQLSDVAARKWGTRLLMRHHGQGHVAEEGFHNHQWMDGQLIIIGHNYFSFAWVPIEQQIFFGRPSPELTLRLLRESGTVTTGALSGPPSYSTPPSVHDSVQVQMDYVTRCLEMTRELHDELWMVDDEDNECEIATGCIWRDADTLASSFE